MMRDREGLNSLAKFIESKIGKELGFALLIFDYGESGRLGYVSNANRRDIVKAMKEWIEKTEQGFGTHQP